MKDYSKGFLIKEHFNSVPTSRVRLTLTNE